MGMRGLGIMTKLTENGSSFTGVEYILTSQGICNCVHMFLIENPMPFLNCYKKQMKITVAY